MVQLFLPVGALLAGSFLVIVALVVPFADGEGKYAPAAAEHSLPTAAPERTLPPSNLSSEAKMQRTQE